MYLLDILLEGIIWIQEIWIKFQMKQIEKRLGKIEDLLNQIPEEEKEEE